VDKLGATLRQGQEKKSLLAFFFLSVGWIFFVCFFLSLASTPFCPEVF